MKRLTRRPTNTRAKKKQTLLAITKNVKVKDSNTTPSSIRYDGGGYSIMDAIHNTELSKGQVAAKHLICSSEQNTAILGAAGSGKSYIAALLIKELVLKNKKVVITASTGTAASDVDGITIHTLLGYLGIEHDMYDIKNRAAGTVNGFKEMDVLIIDEISAVHPDLFEEIHIIASKSRIASGNGKPFGGIRIIVIGDFCQLSPVPKDKQKLGDPTYVFQTELWKKANFITIELCYIWRQLLDKQFTLLCTDVRNGKFTDKSKELMHSLIKNKTEKDMLMCPLRKEAYAENLEKLQKLNGQTYSYTRKLITIVNDTVRKRIQATDRYKPVLLKLGATVRCTKNRHKKINKRSVAIIVSNGSYGIVVGFATSLYEVYACGAELPEPKVDKDTKIVLNNYKDIFKTGANYPIVHYPKLKKPLIMTPVKNTVKYGEIEIIERFIPLSLAWASTVHALQGKTIEEFTHFRVENIFGGAQQVYTALTRVKDSKHISLSDVITDEMIIQDDAIVEFYKTTNKFY